MWEQACNARWIDFNGGGWTWNGIAGTPIAWRAAVSAHKEGLMT
jgi:hypothetical protein